MPATAARTERPMRAVVLLCAALLLGGCNGSFSPRYYWQAASGQLELLRLARPVTDIHAEPATPQQLRERLALATEIRNWASAEMALPDNGSYRIYADLRRPFVVWNVFSADPLSVRPKQSCFPIAGCVSYRGFFGEADARAHADELSKTGLDVHVSGVAAYSTLGWFDDPLLNTFMHYPETELVRLIVHELSHQIVYVRDDTEFNESFASAVEEEGVRRWLARPGKEGLRAGFERAQKMRIDFAALVLKYRDALDSVFRSGLPDAAKLARKSALISELGNEYRTLRDDEWRGFRGYDRWFAQDINNATLASIGLYAGAKPAFARLIERSADMPAVWREMHELAKLPRDERRARLDLPPMKSQPEDSPG
ncbi:MAG: aminopeptidase [Methyloversatilis sp.]|nr:aminopeptidase [Methyloversatilis sp.]MBP6193918.1 aminopeptidase [Methyloversatilis sp.]